LLSAEAFAHAQTSLAARPLAASAVRQRPGVALAIPNRFHDVAECAARSVDHHEFLLRRDRALAMNPHSLTLIFTPANAAVAAIPDALRFGAEHINEPSRDQFAIRLRPTHGEVMIAQVFHSRRRRSVRTAGSMPVHI